MYNNLRITLLLIGVFSFDSCHINHNKTYSFKYYQDFDVFKRNGIKELDNKAIQKRKMEKHIFYKLIYVNNKLDSISIANPYPNSPTMNLKVFWNDSVSVYVTHFPYEGYNKYMKGYYVLSRNLAIQYTNWEDDDWLVVKITPDSSFGGAKLIDYQDTIDIKDKLLQLKVIRITTMPAHVDHPYDKKLNQHFTFSDWLNNKRIDLKQNTTNN